MNRSSRAKGDPVLKRAGDELLSGSFIVSGSCYAEVEHVGRENYANRIANGAKYVKRTNSEILHSLNFIVKTLGFTLVPIGILLFYKQFFLLHDTIREAVVSTVAAILGMIPEGLILLTSVVFAVSVLRLSRYKTLVQDLYCTESLARVDVLCLDKTGTITEGTMQVDELHPLTGYTEEDMTAPLKALVQVLTDDNPTYKRGESILSRRIGLESCGDGAVLLCEKVERRVFRRARHVCDGRGRIHFGRTLRCAA